MKLRFKDKSECSSISLEASRLLRSHSHAATQGSGRFAGRGGAGWGVTNVYSFAQQFHFVEEYHNMWLDEKYPFRVRNWLIVC